MEINNHREFVVGDTVEYLEWEWTITSVSILGKEVRIGIENMSRYGQHNHIFICGDEQLKLVTLIEK